MKTLLHFLTHVYAAVLRLYPPRFRAEFGDEMRAVFEQEIDEARARGKAAILGLFWRELCDAPGALIREHLEERRKQQMELVRNLPRLILEGTAELRGPSFDPTPWREIGLTVLPGLVLLFIHPFSSPLYSEALRFLGLAVLLGMIVSIILQVVAHKSLWQVPAWALVPLGLLTGLGFMSTIGALGFYPACFLLAGLGLVLARRNGLGAGLFVLTGAMIAASWTIERNTYVETGPYAGVLLNDSVIMAVMILTPILVLRARSILGQGVALLFPVAVYSAIFAFPQSGIVWLNIPAIECLLFTPAVASAARRLSARLWIYAGLVILVAFLLLPTALLAESNWPVQLPGTVEYLLLFTIFFTPPAALIIAALLLYSGLTLFKGWRNARQGEGEYSQTRRKEAGRATAVALGLSMLLLGVTLHNLYWLMVWDSTTDSLDYLWLVFPVLAALFAGLLLAIALPRWTKLTGLVCALLLPALMLAVSAQAKSVDFRQLTQARAGQVSQTIERYYAREGRYPQDLHQLTPWYVLFLPGPVVIYGQDWCYDGGADYYRLGYVDRGHWSSPDWFGHIYKTKGAVPELDPICGKEIAARQKRFP